jgi:hypothetical protein
MDCIVFMEDHDILGDGAYDRKQIFKKSARSVSMVQDLTIRYFCESYG